MLCCEEEEVVVVVEEEEEEEEEGEEEEGIMDLVPGRSLSLRALSFGCSRF